MQRANVVGTLLVAALAGVTAPAFAIPFAIETKLIAPDGEAEYLGLEVDVAGDTAMVGAPGSEIGSAPGAVYVYERNAGGTDDWGFVLRLTASDGEAGNSFGNAVAIDEDTAVIGARHDDAGAISSGSAYVLERDAGGIGAWGEVAKLTPSDPDVVHGFGVSVAIDGDTILVGAYLDDETADNAGAAYVFERNAGGVDNWGQVAKIIASDAAMQDQFGISVALSNDTAVIGAVAEDQLGTDSGAAYVFERDAGGADKWGEVVKLAASDGGAEQSFGRSVAIDGDTVIVGEHRGGPGSAHVYDRDAGGAGNWGEVKELTPSDAAPNDWFGYSVAIHQRRAIVGARLDDDGGTESGSAYVFDADEGGANSWLQIAKLVASDDAAQDLLGTAVSIHGDTTLVGGGGVHLPVDPLAAAYLYENPTTRMFVTASAYAGDFGGREGGDAICEVDAFASNLPGHWLALLSAPGADAFDRLPPDRVLTRLDGERLADDAADIPSGIDAPLDLSPNGSVAPVGTHVWTGDSDGEESCDGFTATSDVGRYGITSETDTDWHDAGTDACTQANRLHCFRFDCPGAPKTTCTDAWGKGTLVVKEAKAGKEQIKATMMQGPSLGPTELGSPLFYRGTAYSLCVYDDAGTLMAQLQVARASHGCGNRPCWRAVDGPQPSFGFLYQDRDLAADGLKRIHLRGGAAGKSSISIQAANNANQGLNHLPPGIARKLSGSTSAVLQVHRDDSDQCFSITYDNVQKDTGDFFRAIQ